MVGRPMPRLTYSPSRSSAATFMAIRSGGRPTGPPSRTARPSCSVVRPTAMRICRSTAGSKCVVVRTMRSTKMPGVTTASGSSAPDGDDLAHLGDRRPGGHREGRPEVAHAAAVDQVARRVGAVRLQQREVAADGALEDVRPAVELAHLLALGGGRADAGRRVEAGQPGAAGAHALDERALRHHLERDLARRHLVADRRLEGRGWRRSCRSSG